MIQPLPLVAAALLSATISAAAPNVPAGVISVPVYPIFNFTQHGVELGFGTPPQKNMLVLDTGSYTLGVQTPRSNLCTQPGDHVPCTARATTRPLAQQYTSDQAITMP
jgi:hypothetical protein